MSEYRPHKKTAEMLDHAYSLLLSVPYSVTARWLFYQLFQEGWFDGKGAYKDKFLPAISKARRHFYQDWTPDSLADDTREIYWNGTGQRTVVDWVRRLQREAKCTLDKWAAQPNYVQLWFEAKAMRSQFEWYTDYVTLVPLGGQPSLDLKWRLAEGLESAAAAYGKPLIVLYFGDLDSAGELISDVVCRDVREWCPSPFEFIHCGMTLDQAQQYNVPEHIEKPGQYQWEALPDHAAEKIITDAIAPFVRLDVFSDAVSMEDAATDDTREILQTALQPIIDKYGNGQS